MKHWVNKIKEAAFNLHFQEPPFLTDERDKNWESGRVLSISIFRSLPFLRSPNVVVAVVVAELSISIFRSLPFLRRHFDVTLEELYDEGKKIKIEVREYDDVSRYKKISERTEVVEVGHIDVSKFAELWERAWERTKENVIREHLEEHGIHL